MNKISLCTVCMNRSAYLKKTLPRNIAENLQFPGIEFVLLDYNSKDGLEDWVRSSLGHCIKSGVLKYYKTYDPEYFFLSHSKNMAFKLATGDVLCMIDADNFAGEGYAAWVNDMYEKHGMNTIITTLRADKVPYRDQGGKFCCSRELFSSVKGFDESLVGYGMDDIDLVDRMEKMGGNRVFIENEKHLQFIGHTDDERLKNHHVTNNLKDIYVQLAGLGKGGNRVLYLFKDNQCLDVTYVFNEAMKTDIIDTYGGWKIEDNRHLAGCYEQTDTGLSVTFSNHSINCIQEDRGMLRYYDNESKIDLKRVAREDNLYGMLIKTYTECFNRHRYHKNKSGDEAINPEGWGRGTVYLNFDKSKPLYI